MKTYGMPYMGSKRKLATRILSYIPQRDTLVDLFCGGCAVAHAAMDGNKFKNIIINDINPMCTELFINALSGKYNDEKRWISREDFERLRYTDPYVAVVWSFGNNLRDYLYSREIEPLKRAMHYAIYFGNIYPLTDILPGIDLHGLSDVTEERDRYLSVKHRVEEYLRTHRIAANSNMQHFTASSLIADETGGGTNYHQEEPNCNTSNGDYLSFARIIHAERKERMLQERIEPMGGGTNSIPNGRCSNTSTGDFSYFLRLQHREHHTRMFQLHQPERVGANQSLQYGLSPGGDTEQQRYLLRYTLREDPNLWNGKTTLQLCRVLRMVRRAEGAALHQQLLHALRKLRLHSRVPASQHAERHRQQQSCRAAVRPTTPKGAWIETTETI